MENNLPAVELNEGEFTYASSVFISGKDVYVGGHLDREPNSSVAKIWKNGIAKNLTNNTTHGVVYSVYVTKN